MLKEKKEWESGKLVTHFNEGTISLFTHVADSYENCTKIKESSYIRQRFNSLKISQFVTATCPPVKYFGTPI